MPTTYANIIFRDNSDVLFDPTALKLSDPTGTYGVKRNSNSSVIVANNTDIIVTAKISTGIYQYGFTSVAGVEYTAYFEAVIGGETYWIPRVVTADSGTESPTLSAWFINLYLDVAEAAYNTRTPTAGQIVECKRWVNRGYRSFLSSYPWKCLDVIGTVSLTAVGAGDYTMPTGFSYVRGQQIMHTSDASYAPLLRTSAERILALRANGTAGGPPQFWAVTPKTFVAGTGQQWTLMVWPTPAATYSVKVPYRVDPELLSADGDNPVGGMLFNEAIREFAYRDWERSRTDSVGPHGKRADEEFAKAVRMDGLMRDVGPIPITDGPTGCEDVLVRQAVVTGSASSTNGIITWP